MRAAAAVILLAIQCLATLWWRDTELTGICAAAAVLLLLTGGSHARHQ